MRSPRSRWHSRPSSARVAPRRNDIQRADLPAIRLYDSATRSVRPFEPLERGQVGMYNCGPTVYDRQHIGNLYSYVVVDVLRRTLEYFDLGVKQVMNITDVGHIVDDDAEGRDKMAVGAKRGGRTAHQIGGEYTRRC